LSEKFSEPLQVFQVRIANLSYCIEDGLVFRMNP